MKRGRRPRARGFTLIELLVTLSIAAILLGVAVPSFIDFRRNSELADSVSGLIQASGTAKAGALKSGRSTFVMVNDAAVGWSSGWRVFIDVNGNNVYNAGVDDVISEREALSADITVTPEAGTPLAAGYLMFNASGFPRTIAGAVGRGTVVMAVPNRSTTVVVDTSGRLRSCRTGTTGCSAT